MFTQIKPRLLPLLIMSSIIILCLVGSLTLLGSNVSQVFSQVDSGLSFYPSEYEAESVAGMGEHPRPRPSPIAGEAAAVSKSTPQTARTYPQSQAAPLKAGERNDNADFAAYLAYLNDYQGGKVHTVDVSERSIITVLNEDQHPLLDAHVRVYDGEQQVFEGRTYAGGQTILHPRAVGVSEQTTSLRLVVDYGNQQAETVIERGTSDPITVVVNDATMPDTLQLDIAFLLDTTGSMDDELSRIQETIDTIAQRIDQFSPRPAVRFGLVAYRDRSDEYVTQVYDFVADVASFRKLLNSLAAAGGGDEPESLNEGLHEAVQGIQWRDNAVRLIFLVADAPPHLDYADDYDYVEEIQQSVARGIKIYPIAASNTSDRAEYIFRQVAQQTLSRFIFLTYQPGESGGAPGESTTLEVGEQSYTVDRLDDLIVQVVQRELAAAVGLE